MRYVPQSDTYMYTIHVSIGWGQTTCTARWIAVQIPGPTMDDLDARHFVDGASGDVPCHHRADPHRCAVAGIKRPRRPNCPTGREIVLAMTSMLAVRLNKLFAVMHRAGEPPLSNGAAAEAITRLTGVSVGHDELERWRAAMRVDATVQQLEAIADFFGVPAVYLTDPTDEAAIDAQLNALRAMRDSGAVVQCARTMGPPTPQTLNVIAELIVQVAEGAAIRQAKTT